MVGRIVAHGKLVALAVPHELGRGLRRVPREGGRTVQDLHLEHEVKVQTLRGRVGGDGGKGMRDKPEKRFPILRQTARRGPGVAVRRVAAQVS